MKPFYLSIPHEVELKRGSRWASSAEHEYFVYRKHWLVKERQLGEPARVGEIIGFFQSPPAKGRTFSRSDEEEIEVASVEESIKAVLLQEEVKGEVSSELAAEISLLSIAKLNSKLRAALEQTVKQTQSITDRTQRTTTINRKVKFEWTYTIPDDSAEKWCAAAVYKKFSYDVYLAWVDYLFVRYERPSLFQRTQVRSKYPELTGDRPLNWIKIHQPSFSVTFWQLVRGARICPERDYALEVDDPYEIAVQRLDRPLPHNPRPKIASLYKISNEAFPPRWKKPSHSEKEYEEDEELPSGG